jgi:hypothetical protein|nr:MAG TPA: intron associated endonuclease [Crassvirales sp.]
MREFDLAFTNLRSTYKILPRLPAVYMFFNKINQHRYIGSSINLKSRIRKHLFTFTTSKDVKESACPILLRAVKKYGINNFKLIILFKDSTYSKDLIRSKEQDFINLLNPEYNVVKEVNKCNAFIGKAIHQYSIDGNYIQSYTSICEAARSLKVHDSTLRDLLNHRETGTCKGYQFSYKKLPKITPFINRKFREVLVISSEDKRLAFPSIAAAARFIGVNPSRISEHLKGISTNVKGYKIIYNN